MFVFLIITTFMGIDHANAANTISSLLHQPPSPSNYDQPPSSAPSPLSSPDINKFKKLKCTDFLKEDKIKKVLEHLKAPKIIKKILEKSERFGVCVTNKFCPCLLLGSEPLIIACLTTVGVICMKEALSDHTYACTLSCAKSLMINSNHILGIFFF